MLLLVVGTVLWGTLFMRQGGPSALLHSAASIRAGQESSFYGFLGIWLVQGVALYTWAAFLNGGGREAKRVLMLSVAISLIGGLCLEVRGLTAIAFAASLLIYLRYRRPSRRTIALAALIVVIGVPALALASTVRNYTQLVSTSRAVSLAFSTPPTSFDTADLSPFDNLVAIRKLVPTSVPSLNGSTLVAIPLALVPRSVWSGKPQPLDLQVTSLLYPGGTGGSPIMMQGELYWDLGLAGVILGAGMLGALIGMTARRGAAARTRYGTLAYAVFVPSTLALLTRALATMTGNLVIALVGVGASAWLLSWERRRPARSAPADELTTPSLASASARSA
jgi:oligosaccharide repeat unit polymerase